MKRRKDQAFPDDDLRRQAERHVGAPRDAAPPLNEDSWRRQLHELAVSHVELEMQKAELMELTRSQQEIQDVLSRYAELYDLAPVGYATFDRTGTLQKINQTGARLLGDARNALNGQRLTDFIVAGSRPAFRAFLARVFGNRSKETCEVALITRGGRALQVQIEGNVEASQQACRAVLLDVTERKLASESMQLASLVYQNSSEAMVVADAAGNFLSINPAFTSVTGYGAEEVVGKSLGTLDSGRHSEIFGREILAVLEHAGQWQGEIQVRHKNGQARICMLNANVIRNDDGSVRHFVALLSDITRRKESEQLIWRQANFDALTGLPNRSLFLERLEQEIRKAHRAGRPLALMFLDLDRFKDINETLGHAIGDLLLKEAAQRLCGCVRDTDTVSRLGGDEFTIIVGEIDAHGSIERVAQHILRKMAEPFLLDGDAVVQLSASIGITLYPDDGPAMDTLLKNADQAMYAAKGSGRNGFHYFTPAMQEQAQARMRLIHDLRDAVRGRQFQLYFQPIVDMANGAIHKAEALIRWNHPRRGMIRPAEFIPVAEDTGIIVDIGEWVFREAGRCVARWRSAHDESFQISVNISPVQFLCSAQASAFLPRLGAGAGLVVEITEGLLLDVGSAVTDQLIALRDAGVQVSLDDFGTGYSSLSYLKKFDIDYLKIDQSFVRNLAAGSDDLALCEAIIAMAHKLGLKVVSEGIETEQQRALLAEAGCDFGQGNLYSEALPAAEFEGLLKTGMARRATDSLSFPAPV